MYVVNVMGKFKARKNNKLILIVMLFFVSIIFSVKYLYKNSRMGEEGIIQALLSNNLFSFDTNFVNIKTLFKYSTGNHLSLNNKDEVVINNDGDNDDSPVIKENVLNKKNNLDNPIVYIYSTHDEEAYSSGMLKPYNIKPTVKSASKILKENLENLGIKVTLEEKSIADEVRKKKEKYGYSYKVSRMFMEEAYKNNNNLKYFIDFHRDSSVYKETVINIDGEDYARLLFVIGLDNKKYESNLEMANKLADLIKEYNPNLFRGIMKKSGKKVNGVYNQDFNPNTILVEVGGQYNNISEVNNTLKVFADILYKYIKDDNDG